MEGKQRTTYSSYSLLWQPMGMYQLSTHGTKNVTQSVKRDTFTCFISKTTATNDYLSIQFVIQILNVQSVHLLGTSNLCQHAHLPLGIDSKIGFWQIMFDKIH